MFKGMSNIYKQAQKMQKDMKKVQDELEDLKVEGQAGGGIIKVVVNGKKEPKSVTIDSSVLDEDKEMIEDLVLVAMKNAFDNADKESSEKAVIYLNKQIAKTSLSEIRQATASLLEKEIQKLTLIEANKDYVFEYIYPPSVMEKKSKPNRLLIVILFVVFGGFLGMIIVLFKHYFLKDKNALEKLRS